MERTNDYETLNVLVGKWQTKGKTIARDGEKEQLIEGTDTYEWMPGKFYLKHDADVTFGNEHLVVLELIGPYDKVSRSFAMRAFDSTGVYEEMHATIDEDGILTFTGNNLRATLTPEYDRKSMSATWERNIEGSWTPWMQIDFTRIA